jgi:hypothetical protein
MKKNLLKSMVGIVLLGAAGAASADIVTVTYAGTVTQGEDASGVFGTPLEMFATSKPAYTLVFTFDTTVGSLTTYSNQQLLVGGSSQTPPPGGTPSPGSAVLTINGISFSDNGGYVGRDYAYAVSHSGLTQQATQETGTSGSGILGYAFSGGVDNALTTRFPVRITTNGTYTIIPSDIVSGTNYFSILTAGFALDASGEFTPTTVTVSDLSAVPLPATAWLLLSGLAGMGAMARRRLTPA